MLASLRFDSILLILIFTSRIAFADADAVPRAGHWKAWIESKEGPIEFGLTVEHEPEFRVWTVNGPDTTRIEGISFDGPTMVLAFDAYDSEIRVRSGDEGRALDGIWTRRFEFDEVTTTRMIFRARYVESPSPAALGDAADLPMKWSVQLSDLPHPSVLTLDVSPELGVHGALWNGTGDYGMMAGSLVDGRLRLSKFDGAHAMLLDLVLSDGDRFEGTYAESGYRVTRVTGQADANPAPPPTFEQFRVRDRFDLSERRFPTLDGPDRSLATISAGARAIVLEVFGTWCPTCHSLSTFLEELQREYGDRGLVVIGMAFEMTADLERNRRAVRRYVERHGLSYPMVFGFSDRGRPPRDVFPQIEGVFSYPSLLFLRPDGTIEAAHTGFAGPATGAAHTAMRAEFHAMIEGMLETAQADN